MMWDAISNTSLLLLEHCCSIGAIKCFVVLLIKNNQLNVRPHHIVLYYCY